MRRPTSVLVTAVFSIISGALMLATAAVFLAFAGIAPFTGITSVTVAMSSGMALGIAIVLAVLGLIGVIDGSGTLLVSSWAWPTSVLTFGVGVIASLYALAATNYVGIMLALALPAALLSLVVVFFLYEGEVREALRHTPGHFFRAGRGGPSSTGMTA